MCRMGSRYSHRKRQFLGVFQAIEKHWESLLWCMQQKGSLRPTADCNAPRLVGVMLRCPLWKVRPPAMQPSFTILWPLGRRLYVDDYYVVMVQLCLLLALRGMVLFTMLMMLMPSIEWFACCCVCVSNRDSQPGCMRLWGWGAVEQQWSMLDWVLGSFGDQNLRTEPDSANVTICISW